MPLTRIFLAALVALVVSGAAWANDPSPDRSDFWMKMCDSPNTPPDACQYYVAGMVEGMVSGMKAVAAVVEDFDRAPVGKYLFGCWPEEASATQLIRIWVKYLKGHPEEHHLMGSITYSNAIKDAFPCEDGDTTKPVSKLLSNVKPEAAPNPYVSVLETIASLQSEDYTDDERDTIERLLSESLNFEEQMDQALKTQRGMPLSISVHEAVAAQLRKCWVVPAGIKDAEDVIIAIRVDMNPDATVRNSTIVDMDLAMSDSFYRAAAESALRATKNPRCQPLPLPLDQYEQWRTMTLNFNPQDML
jgi:hypothetical protein